MSTATTHPFVSRDPEYDPETRTMRATRSLRGSGNSTVLSIPPLILQALAVQEGDEVELIADTESHELTIRAVTQKPFTRGNNGNG